MFLLFFQMIMLLKEYLSSGEIPEATRCLQELEVPHFHHELVYEVCKLNLLGVLPGFFLRSTFFRIEFHILLQVACHLKH